jgi:hypothetical protein
MSAGTGGKVSPASGWKNSGATVSISATPTNNTQVSYSFAGWTGSGTGSYSGTNNPASIAMNGPITETASFHSRTGQVTVQTNPQVLRSRLMALLTLRPKPFRGSRVQATPLPLLPAERWHRRSYIWTKWSDNGAISHTVAPALTRLTQRHSRPNIT